MRPIRTIAAIYTTKVISMGVLAVMGGCPLVCCYGAAANRPQPGWQYARLWRAAEQPAPTAGTGHEWGGAIRAAMLLSVIRMRANQPTSLLNFSSLRRKQVATWPRGQTRREQPGCDSAWWDAGL